MNSKCLVRYSFAMSFLVLLALLFATGQAVAAGSEADSYHGQLGRGSGLGMLEKWCALPNFSFDQQGGIEGWIEQGCGNCHIGARWNLEQKGVDCSLCHEVESSERFLEVNVAKCMGCHSKDIAKRGVSFTPEQDVHIALGFVCQDCHVRVADESSGHQLLKGTALDTTEPTMQGTLSCTTACHSTTPHGGVFRNDRLLDEHTDKVACETCHTGLRPAAALASRKWNVFTEDGKPVTTMREPGWLPEYKWYDNKGAGAAGGFHLPVLGHTERRNAPGAKIYPFNAVTVEWFVQDEFSDYDDVIIVPEVKAADSNDDGTVTVEEMRVTHPGAVLVKADMNFSISHSVKPASRAFDCDDCHGGTAWVLDWNQLGYARDPHGGPKYRVKKSKKK